MGTILFIAMFIFWIKAVWNGEISVMENDNLKYANCVGNCFLFFVAMILALKFI